MTSKKIPTILLSSLLVKKKGGDKNGNYNAFFIYCGPGTVIITSVPYV